MEHLFGNLFPITNTSKSNINRIAELESENARLKQTLRETQTYNMKRKRTIEVLNHRIGEQQALIEKLNNVMKSQNQALLKAKATIEHQCEQVAHYEHVVARMNAIRQDQAQILEFVSRYEQDTG